MSQFGRHPRTRSNSASTDKWPGHAVRKRMAHPPSREADLEQQRRLAREDGVRDHELLPVLDLQVLQRALQIRPARWWDPGGKGGTMCIGGGNYGVHHNGKCSTRPHCPAESTGFLAALLSPRTQSPRAAPPARPCTGSCPRSGWMGCSTGCGPCVMRGGAARVCFRARGVSRHGTLDANHHRYADLGGFGPTSSGGGHVNASTARHRTNTHSAGSLLRRPSRSPSVS